VTVDLMLFEFAPIVATLILDQSDTTIVVQFCVAKFVYVFLFL
jgi:hypothetical protein